MNVLNDRGARYGSFEAHAMIVEKFINTSRLSGSWGDMHPYQRQAFRAISDKMARILNGDPHYIDSWRDIAGYATRVIEILSNHAGSTDARVEVVKLNEKGEWEKL